MYVEGLVVPVEKSRLEEYKQWAHRCAERFLEHGATRVVENMAEGLDWGKTTSFPRAVQQEDGEVTVFSWLEFPDKTARDACMEKVFDDPRMGSPEDMPMDGKRMIFGGFDTLVDRS